MMTELQFATGLATVVSLTAAFVVWRVFFRKKPEPPSVGPVKWDDGLSREPSEEDIAVAFAEAELRAKEEHARTKCIKCDEKATHYAPMISGAPLDEWFIIGGIIGFFWELFSLPQLYRVVQNKSGGLCYCAPHEQDEHDALRNECAQLRAAHAQFNAEQQRRVALKNRGLLRKAGG